MDFQRTFVTAEKPSSNLDMTHPKQSKASHTTPNCSHRSCGRPATQLADKSVPIVLWKRTKDFLHFLPTQSPFWHMSCQAAITSMPCIPCSKVSAADPDAKVMWSPELCTFVHHHLGCFDLFCVVTEYFTDFQDHTNQCKSSCTVSHLAAGYMCIVLLQGYLSIRLQHYDSFESFRFKS